MAITWNIDEARATIQAQMDEANRLDGMIDTIAAERDALIQANAMLAADLGAAERERDKAINIAAQRCTELKRVRHALAAPSNGDLGDLIDALRTRAEATEADLLAVRTTLDGVIDTIAAERDAANARADAAGVYIERIRTALGGYEDSDLASLAETLCRRNEALEAEAEQMRTALRVAEQLTLRELQKKHSLA